MGLGRVELLGFPFVDPFEEAQRLKREQEAEGATEGESVEDGGGSTTGGSKESTPGREGSVGGGATKPRKTKPRKGVIKVHKVTVDEVPGVGSIPDPYY